MSESDDRSSRHQVRRRARILLDGVTKRYDAQSAARRRQHHPGDPRGRDRHARRPLGVRQDHHDEDDQPTDRADERTHSHRRRRRDRRDADELRRHIGYVIQGAGLFPHLTVGDNIAIVPRLLKWDKKRIARRVDELLDLVSLDPAQYRDRYPRELSGGQQQRVGVARALAADPPVLLMDEPFGAVDPITRQRLQDELLRLQEELRKTIVFVTHDFDEAVKLGDKIAILRAGSKIVQYDTPEQHPRRTRRRLRRAASSARCRAQAAHADPGPRRRLHEAAVARIGGNPGEAIAAARADRPRARHRPRRPGPTPTWMSLAELERSAGHSTRVPRDEELETVNLASTLNDALDSMLTSSHGVVVVTGRRNTYRE